MINKVCGFRLFFDDVSNSTKMQPAASHHNRIYMCNCIKWPKSIRLKPLLLLHFVLVTRSVSHNHVVLPGWLFYVEAVFYI